MTHTTTRYLATAFNEQMLSGGVGAPFVVVVVVALGCFTRVIVPIMHQLQCITTPQ